MSTIAPLARQVERRLALVDWLTGRHLDPLAPAIARPELQQKRFITRSGSPASRSPRRSRLGCRPVDLARVKGTHDVLDGDPPLTVDSLALQLEVEIRTGNDLIKHLALRYRPQLEQLGKLHPTSTQATALRRLQQFLEEHVYDVLIPHDELPARIRSGRESGGRRRGI